MSEKDGNGPACVWRPITSVLNDLKQVVSTDIVGSAERDKTS
jgi:hypothetical protein